MSTAQTGGHDHPTTTPLFLIVLAWVLVTVPLAYGLFQTVRTAIPLFTG